MNKSTIHQNVFSKQKSSEAPGFVLWQVYMIWQRAITKRLSQLELTHPQFVLLASLLWLSKSSEPITQITLSKHTKIDAMTVSQILKNLEKHKYIQRKVHPHDTRAKVVVLTEKGINKARLCVPEVEKLDHDFFKVLNNQESEFIKLLNTLIETNGGE